MPSKLSLYLSSFPDRVYDIIERMQPSVLTVFNFPSEMNIDQIRSRSPRTTIIYRQYTNLDYHNPADQFFSELGDTIKKLAARGILWEGINEPIVNSVADLQALNAWTVRFAQLMHAQGEQVVGFSWSTGNPVNISQAVSYLKEAAAAVDVHAFHEYYSTWGVSRDWVRYRQFEELLPANARKPVVVTEAGLDDNGDPYTGGFRGKISNEEYLHILQAYDDFIMQDPYVLGATVYQWGDYGWPSFELTPVIDGIANYVASEGGGANIPRPWPIPTFGPPTPTLSFTASPESILKGQTATLVWNIEGVRSVFLNGQGVTGHESRQVTPTQTTAYVLHVVKLDGSSQDLTKTITVRDAQISPTFTFSAVPDIIVAGQSVTVRWDVEGVREVYFEGKGVTGHETRAIAPDRTTSYVLKIVFLDGTTKELTATVTVQPDNSTGWDSQLDALGVRLERTEASQGWRLTTAKYVPPAEAQSKHHIVFTALRADGTPAPGLKFVIDWVGRDPSDDPAIVITDESGSASCALWAGMDPAKKDGIYFTLPKDEPGDKVLGMGLPKGEHACFLLTFKKSG